MRIRLAVEDLLLASWETSRASVESVAPPGVEPGTVDGRFLVSLVSFRVRGGRVGRMPVLPFSQLNVRTYVLWNREPAVLFLASRVTAGGLPGIFLGAPYRLARLRVRTGTVRAPGLGLELAYRPGGAGDPGELGRHELGIFESAGLRSIRIVRGPADWQSAEAVGGIRADVLIAHGFPVQGEPDLVYAPTASFEAAPVARLA